ncbi:MAG: ACP S-malonyltransferase [Calditrichaeota bacterium]|nr:ACP S-malonyltransferase [Calditrichota bacterium]MCB0302257.1 ACP S-malonyltransferase [Calditrichota bacterium]MCB0312605.1 ACP S-malonyltransferase [Calditrichota bacterium]
MSIKHLPNVAFLFPGQGSQYVGMGQDLYGADPAVRDLFDEAETLLEFPLKQICFEGPEEVLKQTRYTQPAIFVHSLAIDLLLRRQGVAPDAAAGHSLGEYSALVSAGAIAFADGVRLVKIRGELMQRAGDLRPGTMAAILGLSPEQIESVCAAAAGEETVQPANFNCPGQIVISGSVPAVHRAMELAKESGAKIVKELVVSGAFHSPLMGEALHGLKEALATVDVRPAAVPVYSNVKAQPVTSPEEIRALLQQQLMAPVRWEEILRNMIAAGHDDFYEVGPGRVLQGLLKRTDRQAACRAVGTVDDLAMEKDG